MTGPTRRTLHASLGTRAAIAWQAVLLALACFAPLIASGHPLFLHTLDASGMVIDTTSPLIEHLTRADWLFLALPPALAPAVALVRWQVRGGRSAGVALVILVAALVLRFAPAERLAVFDYSHREALGEARAVYTLIPFSPSERSIDEDRALLPPGASADDRPGARIHRLGTDRHGHDVLSRLVHACRLAVTVGLIAAGIATTIGVLLGAIMGFIGGWIDLMLSRLVEAVASVPLLFVLVLAAAVMPRSLEATMALIGCFTWPTAARLTRAEILRLRSSDFALAARAAGLPRARIMLRHLLPNAAAPALVDAAFTLSAAVVLEATLSYLGLGPARRPSWGDLLASAPSQTGQLRWWLILFPGAAIALTVLSYNILGEALRDRLDPRAR